MIVRYNLWCRYYRDHNFRGQFAVGRKRQARPRWAGKSIDIKLINGLTLKKALTDMSMSPCSSSHRDLVAVHCCCSKSISDTKIQNKWAHKLCIYETSVKLLKTWHRLWRISLLEFEQGKAQARMHGNLCTVKLTVEQELSCQNATAISGNTGCYSSNTTSVWVLRDYSMRPTGN